MMRKYSAITMLIVLFLTQSVLAHDKNDSMKQCETIASMCKNAGYTDEGTGDKSFWFGCMRPVLLGKSVNDVTIEAKDVKACRQAKIEKMKKEIRELQSIK